MKLDHFHPWIIALLFAFAASVQGSSKLPNFVDLVAENSPSVVKINTVTRSRAGDAPNMQMPENVPEIFRHFFDHRYMPRRDARSMGSGFVISEDGYILTNNHVIDGADEIVVRLIDRREFDATIVGTDPQTDLALIKIDADNLPSLKLGDSENVKVGEWVLAIGSPFGLDYSVSQGIVSAIGRSIPSGGNQNYVPFIQTDVAINPGNSGGPLFNLNGEVIGINSQIYTRSGGSIGLSFAIPSNLAKDVVAQLKENGRVERGWLGVVIQDVDKDLALSFGLEKPEGALISQLEPGGPADLSGLKVSDIITEFNGRKIVTSSDLPHVVGPTKPGSTVPVTIMRKGKPKKLDVTVGKRDDADSSLAGNNSGGGRLGLVVDAFDSPEDGVAGVVVNRVLPGSPADKANLQPGDVIVELGFDKVASVSDFNRISKALPANKPQSIRVIRRGVPMYKSITIAE